MLSKNETWKIKTSQHSLSKREWVAAMAMQGLLACDMVGNTGFDGKQIAEMAIHYADGLLLELSKTQS